MGRTEPTVVKPPAAFRRDARAKRARATINKVIPGLLTAHPRARKGIESSELIVDPPRFRGIHPLLPGQQRGPDINNYTTGTQRGVSDAQKEPAAAAARKNKQRGNEEGKKRLDQPRKGKVRSSKNLGKAQNRRLEIEQASLEEERLARVHQSDSRKDNESGSNKRIKDASQTSAHGFDTNGYRITLRVSDTLEAAHSLFLGESQDHDRSNTSKMLDGSLSIHNKKPTPKDRSERSGSVKDKGRRCNDKGRGKIGILNMASPLSPGGGFLNGATSQEETLCMRTTLLPALRDEFYRLPELGVVYTPDVLVFRRSSSHPSSAPAPPRTTTHNGEEKAEGESDEDEAGTAKEKDVDVLPKNDRWFVDVVSAAMLRLPDTETETETLSEIGIETNNTTSETDDDDDGEDNVEAHSHQQHRQQKTNRRYTSAADRELVRRKMRAVMRVLASRGCERVVLGAWGCGAYGNPVGEIAEAWRRVLVPAPPPSHNSVFSSTSHHPVSHSVESDNRSRKGEIGGRKRDTNKDRQEDETAEEQEVRAWATVIKEVVFAIQDANLATAFARAFGEDVLPLPHPLSFQNVEQDNDGRGGGGQKTVAHELRAKIAELETQLSQVRSLHMRQGLESILAGLRREMPSASSSSSADVARQHDDSGGDEKVEDSDGNDEDENENGDEYP
ncbi:hypothetical protein F5Y17DRAFT_413352 [Xylariaceae sp. FL0594]|nr:hypothetical protein F5Y17DRAFT_413352 [Xylariaceae sp. FL0594]